ncbi:MAG: hypothetical protein K6G53_08870 [Bacteroidales bacterium]|nr:hypothetical protein [Bacteroidales bacterium]
MKRFFVFAALAAFALTSCEQKIDIPAEIPTPGSSESTGLVFTATTESAVTKTALDDNYNVLWQNGDMITIVDGASHVGVYSTTSTTTQGEFTKESGDMADTPSYTAYYPSTIYKGGTLTLPAEQTYVAENISGAPMMAVSSTTSLGFKNLVGIIKLSLTTNQSGQKVRSIALSANEGMSGPFTVNNDAAVVSGTAGVTLNCGTEGVAIGSTAIPFYIAVPANTYTGLSITVTTTTGASQTFTLKADKTVVVARSEITSINLSANNIHSAYDLTAGDVTVQAGEVATVTGSNANSVLTIGAGATVTLQNATLKQIVTQGDATLILSGTNTQTTEFTGAAIQIADNATLTIDGTGSLNIDRGWSSDYGCIFGPNSNLVVNGGTMVLDSNRGKGNRVCVAINLKNYSQSGGSVEAYGKFTNDVGNSYANGMQISNDVLITGGTLRTEGATALWVGNNISISGGTVTAIGTYAQDSGSTGIVPGGNKTGGKLTISGGTVRAEGNGGGDGQGPGIGRRTDACGDIIISGGDVTVSSTARSGFAGGAAAIGTGSDATDVGCNITITSGITRLVVTKGENAQAPIGKGNASSSVGTITIDGVENPTAESFFENLNLAVSNGGNTWTLTPRTVVDLASVTSEYTAQDGEVLTGILGSIVQINVAAGASIVLKDATINGVGHDTYYAWSGLNCLGDATITLVGTNTVRGFNNKFPGINVPFGNDLIIRGTGALHASTSGWGAGIGGGQNISCGNIRIEGGDIIAVGGEHSAGIGGGWTGSAGKCGNIVITGGTIHATGYDGAAGIGAGSNSNCGDITISGGDVTAIGGIYAAGIGSSAGNSSTVGACGNISITGGTIHATGGNASAGIGGGYYCGTIDITDGVTEIIATKGAGAPNSIGAGQNAICGTVTIASGANVTQN